MTPDLKTAYTAAQKAIRDKDQDALVDLLRQDPELAQAEDESGQTLMSETLSYANYAGDAPRFWTSTACAEALIDAGATVAPAVYMRAMDTADTEMVRMFARRGVLPVNLRTAAVVGDLDRVRTFFLPDGTLAPEARPAPSLLGTEEDRRLWPDPQEEEKLLADAFRFACRHHQRPVAEYLLDQAMERSPELRQSVEGGGGAAELMTFLLDNRRALNVRDHHYTVWEHAQVIRLQQTLVSQDVAAFKTLIAQEPQFLAQRHTSFQVDVLEGAAFGQGIEIARALLDAGASIGQPPRPPSRALVYAIECGDQAMIDLLSQLWEAEEDLATLSGLGQLERVKGCFDAEGRVLAAAVPKTVPPPGPQEVRLHALGLAVMNQKLEVVQFLLDRGADINGPWGLHEAASVLHEAAANGKMAAVRFLVDKGADLTLRDERYHATAYAWAEFTGQEEAYRFLLERAARVDLFAAAQAGDVKSLGALLQAGTDPNATRRSMTARGLSPLFVAVSYDHPNAVEVLLRHGAQADQVDSTGRGALHRLQRDAKHALTLAELLVGHGALLDAASSDGVTPLAHARAMDLDSVVDFLSRSGAKS